MWVNHLKMDPEMEIKAKATLDSPPVITTWNDVWKGNKYTSLKCIADALSLIKPSFEDYIILCSQADEVGGDTIINNVKAKASVAFIPKECDDGEEYMGKHYILERVDLLNDDN